MSKPLPDGTVGFVAGAMSRAGSIATTPVAIGMAAALLFVANVTGGFPGVSNADAESQYAQAVAGQFNDWHPPIMTWLWSMFRLLADGNGPMFCFHIAGYWLGFGLVAVALARTGRPLAAWGILGVGLFPPFLMMTTILYKDVGLAVTFLTAFAALFWYRMQERKIPLPVVAVAVVLLFYGTLVRTNAVFAVVPLLAYMIDPRWLHRPWRVLVFSIPVALCMIPVSNLFNHGVLKANPIGLIRSLQIFDMAGIAFYSGDPSVLRSGHSFTRQELEHCYTPTEWDPLSPWGKCRFFWNRLAVSQDVQGVEQLGAMAVMEVPPNPDLSHDWVASIVEHPLAYATHRLAHFGSEMLGAAEDSAVVDAPEPTVQDKLYLAFYDAVTPAVSLAMAACLLALLALVRSPRPSAHSEAALALALSGLTYTGAYLVIGVATDFRYQFWSMIATFVAVVISLSAFFRRMSVQSSGASA